MRILGAEGHEKSPPGFYIGLLTNENDQAEVWAVDEGGCHLFRFGTFTSDGFVREHIPPHFVQKYDIPTRTITSGILMADVIRFSDNGLALEGDLQGE